jgi:hypothetical protein
MYQMYHSEEVGIYTYVLGYMILYMPTLALVNSVAFKQMKDPEKNFQILEFGNYWMDISRTIYQLYFHWDSRRSSRTIKNTFLLSGIAALVLGLFSFILPKTPPTIVSNEKSELVIY